MMTETARTLFVDEAGMVSIAGRRFPSVIVVCPPGPDRPDQPEWDRSLGGTGPGDGSHWIPAENGLLFMVEDWNPSAPHETGRLELGVYARTCDLARFPNDDHPMYLPWRVGASDGWGAWWGCEPWWVVEQIDRLSRRPFTQPPGPEVRLVRRVGDAR